ncbi:MAG: ABC transporter permease [Lewinellaceae bacterium]|nr:ABC transporter permease [Saprospiraceae bacterium]MCB9336799.1 ABC transporter permease [Lewinellaceae bacterium]
MLSNYLKIAFRNLLKNKSFSFINIFGLTMGTACCLYILLYVQDQRNYDHQHHDAGNLYRVITDLGFADRETMHMSTCSPPIVPTMKAEFPEVEAVARVCSPPGVDQNLFRIGDKVFYEKKGFLADSTFFRVFDYRFLQGDPAHALDEPFSVVVSEDLAKKLFNTNEAVGQTVSIGGGDTEEKFKVTGVFNGDLGKSHLMPAFFMSMNSGGLGQFVRSDDSWAGNNFIYGYVRLKSGADAKALEAKLPDFLQRHGADQLRQLNMAKTLFLQPVTEIHTTAGLNAELSPVTGNRMLNIMLLIAGFIQLVACINFMNLSTARSSRRAQEVGVRKAIGANRGALVGQFLGESLMLAFAAVLLAIPLIEFAMPLLNRLTGAEIDLDFTQNWNAWLMVIGLVLLTGLAAGSYPAFYLSSFKPIQVLRGSGGSPFRGSGGGGGGSAAVLLRKSLVVSQFVIAAALIIGAFVIHKQLDYMLTTDLGFEKNQKVVFPFHSVEGQRHLEAFRNGLMNLPEVNLASGVLVLPGQAVFNDIGMYKEGEDMDRATDVRFTYTDENYLPTLKIKLLAGRALTMADTTTELGKNKLIVNETVLKELRIPLEEAPGKILRSKFRERDFEFTIVGVMQDFNFAKLGSSIDPFAITIATPVELSQVVADVNTGDYTGFLKKAEALWNNTLPGLPFEYSFLDQDFEKLYTSERTLSRIISAFTIMAILISCLGLFGLSAFTTEQRTKEIGVRKVLGATVTGIVVLLSKDFLKLVGVAIVIASPLAWFGMKKWLEGFAYQTHLGWEVFLLTGLVAVGVAFLTVSFQSVKAALSNPVKSLRSE